MTARDWQDQVPGWLAAFMTAADAAIDGREALTIAPSLPLGGTTEPSSVVQRGADADQAADGLAALTAALRDRLTSAAVLAVLPGDQAACQDAAQAAERICQLMTRGGT